MTDDLNRDDAFIERVAAALRTPVRGDESFAARVLAGIETSTTESSPRDARSWWLRPRTVRVTPLAGLALAAAIAAIVLGANALALRSPSAAQSVASATADTVHLVRFVFVDSSARTVTLVGSFNDWTKDTTPMQQDVTPGVWSVSVALPPGRHEYAFVVRDSSGERWIADPAGIRRRDEFGTESSIISIGGTT